jgi:hypothetical protein
VLLTKCYLSDQIKKDEMGRAFSTYKWKKGAYWILVGKPEGKKPLDRPRRRWEDDINESSRSGIEDGTSYLSSNNHLSTTP